MSNTLKAFTDKKAFIPFITAGDPSLDITKELILKMADAGADLIEIGIPFSDPIAEGIVIQNADERALAGGTTTDKIFQMVRSVRQSTKVPLAFMTYMNPIFAYGPERFFENCQQCQMDAIIVPDMPFEEKGELQESCNLHGMDLISLIAPTSNNRIRMIAKEAQGFVYCVSSMGVTGVRNEFSNGLEEMVQLVKAEKEIPCAIGFGISTPSQAKQMAQYADGVIVGSAIIKIIETYGKDCVPYVVDYVKEMKEAIS